jgi:serine/threonine protein kinase
MIDISSIAEKFIQKEREKKLPSTNNKNSSIQNASSTINKNILNKNIFKFLYVIGKGGFSKVWKIQSKKTKTIYALKEMSKLKIIDKKSEKSINSEREFLSKLNHPFIVNMHYAFQDKQNLYLIMDILNGGDLRYHISRYRKFSEEQTRFFIANIIYSLQYIHSNNVIHRDIKPENLILDEKGYVRITDFGIAKENMPDNSSETSGTPGYMAPEVMKAKNHSFAVDFFAIGVIGYEFMLGKRPYYGKNRKEIKEQMLSKQAVITEETIAHGWSTESMDFINSLLQRKEEKRLGARGGSKGADELMKHLWLKYYPWNDLKNKTLLAPFIPEPKDNYDKLYCESIDKISEETQLRYEEIYCSSHFKTVFDNFFYNEDEPEEKARKEKMEKERKEQIERERQKEIEEEKERIREMEREKIIKEKEKERKEKLKKKKENIEINPKIHNLNNKSSTDFYIINKNISSNNNNNYQKILNNIPQSDNYNTNISGKKIVFDKNKKKINNENKRKTLSYSN